MYSRYLKKESDDKERTTDIMKSVYFNAPAGVRRDGHMITIAEEIMNTMVQTRHRDIEIYGEKSAGC